MERLQASRDGKPALGKAAWLAAGVLWLILLLGCNALLPSSRGVEVSTTQAAPGATLPAEAAQTQPAATTPPQPEPVQAAAFRVVEQKHEQEVATGTLTYTLEVSLPLVEAAPGEELSEAAEGWNRLIEGENGQIEDEFVQAVTNLPADMAMLTPGGSFLSIKPVMVYSDTQTLSVLMAVHTYMSGAAHPGTVHRAYNYDMQAGKLYAWSDVLVPGLDEAQYLQVISAACVTKLKAQPGSDPEQGGWLFPEFETVGAAPVPENYRVWNITGEGLLITFEEYQIAPYAAGPQQVVLLKDDLVGWLNPDGPLGEAQGEH